MKKRILFVSCLFMVLAIAGFFPSLTLAELTAISGSEAKSEVDISTTTTNSPTATGGIGVGIGGGGGQGGQGVASVQIDSHAVTNNKYVNRQFPQVGIPGAPNQMQYFGQYKNEPWNVFPPIYGEWVSTKLTKTPYDKIWKRINQTFPETQSIIFVEAGKIRGGVLVGSVAVMLNPDQGTDDAQAIIATIAKRNGAEYVEIISSSSLQVPTSKGWHVGFGAGASGVVGSDEKAGVSGAGGTGFGESSIVVEQRPFMQARLWSNGRKINATAEGATGKKQSKNGTAKGKQWQVTQ